MICIVNIVYLAALYMRARKYSCNSRLVENHTYSYALSLSLSQTHSLTNKQTNAPTPTNTHKHTLPHPLTNTLNTQKHNPADTSTRRSGTLQTRTQERRHGSSSPNRRQDTAALNLRMARAAICWRRKVAGSKQARGLSAAGRLQGVRGAKTWAVAMPRQHDEGNMVVRRRDVGNMFCLLSETPQCSGGGVGVCVEVLVCVCVWRCLPHISCAPNASSDASCVLLRVILL